MLAGELAAPAADPAPAGAADADPPDGTESPDTVRWSGVVAGPHPAQVGKLAEFATGRSVLPVDMTDVERVDFVGAGAVFNAIKTLEEQGKAVQILGATPIVRAMLLLIGVSPGHFYKKSSP